MGLLFLEALSGPRYSCRRCCTPLAKTAELVSKAFHCRRGRAYLFNVVANVCLGPLEDRYMTTGLHSVADIRCCSCLSVVGWKYEAAFEASQQFKVGKFILERAKCTDRGRGGTHHMHDAPGQGEQPEAMAMRGGGDIDDGYGTDEEEPQDDGDDEP